MENENMKKKANDFLTLAKEIHNFCTDIEYCLHCPLYNHSNGTYCSMQLYPYMNDPTKWNNFTSIKEE